MTTSVPVNPAAMPLDSARVIRVASVPSSHVYVRHLAPVDRSAVDLPAEEPAVQRLPDPHPDDPRQSAVSRWWPPAMLEPAWVRENSGAFDVFHLQFGFDARTPEELRELVQTLRDAGRPLVYTVHDLRNPHHSSRDEHDAQLDVLIPAADALVTLTPGAAAEIARRWGREATVLPHPHVVDLATMAAVQAERASARDADGAVTRPFRVGVHVKSLRASMDPRPVIEALIDAARSRPEVVLQVDGHHDVLTPGGQRYDAELATALRSAADRGEIDLRVHDYFSDDELWAYLGSLDASVLPYRFGTHSGWLEACRDLGTAVIAPDCGYYADQGPVFGYHNDDGDGLDARSLQRALIAAIEAGPVPPASVADRLRQREHVAAAHLALYRALAA